MSTIVFCFLLDGYIVTGTPVLVYCKSLWYSRIHMGVCAGVGAGTYLHVWVQTHIYLHVWTSNSPVPSSSRPSIIVVPNLRCLGGNFHPVCMECTMVPMPSTIDRRRRYKYRETVATRQQLILGIPSNYIHARMILLWSSIVTMPWHCWNGQLGLPSPGNLIAKNS